MSRTARAAEGTAKGLSPAIDLGISICLTGLFGLAFEYLGARVLHLYSYATPGTFYVAIYAFGLGPMLYLLRRSPIIVPMLLVAGVLFFLELANHYQVDYRITSLSPTSADCVMAAHEALRELDLKPAASSREVLQRLNEYIAEIRSRRRGVLAFPFWLLEHLPDSDLVSPAIFDDVPRRTTLDAQAIHFEAALRT